MRVKYIGMSDSREVSSTDLGQQIEGEWIITWAPDQVHEVDEEAGQFLVGYMKNEFRDVTEYNTDAELNAQAEAEEEPVAEPAGDGFWDLPQPDPESEEDEELEEEEDLSAQPGWLDADQLDGNTSKTVLQRQMRFRRLDPEGMTRRAMLDAISEHDDLASSREPEEGEETLD